MGFKLDYFVLDWLLVNQPYVMSLLIHSVCSPPVFLLCCFIHGHPFLLSLSFPCFLPPLPFYLSEIPHHFSSGLRRNSQSFVHDQNLLPNFLFRLFSHSCYPSTQGHRVNPAQLRELSTTIYFHSLRYAVFLYTALSIHNHPPLFKTPLRFYLSFPKDKLLKFVPICQVSKFFNSIFTP